MFGISIQTQWVSSILVQLAEWPGRSGLVHAACDMLDSKWVLENSQGLFDESPWRINTCSPHHVTETGTVWKFDKDMAQKLHWHQTARTFTALTFSSNNVMKWAKREISPSDSWAVTVSCLNHTRFSGWNQPDRSYIKWGLDNYYAHLQMQTRKEWVAKHFLHHVNKAIIPAVSTIVDTKRQITDAYLRFLRLLC